MPRSHDFSQPGNSLRIKVAIALCSACAVVVAFTAIVVYQQLGSIERAARLEARNLARSIAYGARLNSSALQAYVQGLDGLYKRDIFIVDRQRRTIANVIVSELGQTYTEDHANEVEQTIIDGEPRTFLERSAQHPDGAKLVVAPLYAGPGTTAAISGAVVLEYTGIYQELLHASLWQLAGVGAAGFLCAVLIGVAGLGLATSIVVRIERLQHGVSRMTNGQYDSLVPGSSNDEIGLLTHAFNTMMGELQSNRAQLQLEIQKEKEGAQRIEYLAYTDDLTGLPNRAHFSRMLSSILRQAGPTGERAALFFIDIDRFKNINDTLGHEAGDTLIKLVALRIRECLRPGDVLARLGGDEFVVTLPTLNGPEQLAEVARSILSTVAQPLLLSQHELRVTASIGISVHPSDGSDERTLMKNADIALYRAKEDWRNTFAFYAAALDEHSIERLALERDLERALDSNQIEVHYQPKVDAQTSRIMGVEALVRWRHPELGWVSPAQFIPVAEETGLILRLGRWVLDTACRQQVAWQQLGLGPVRVAVNLSPRQFADEGLLRDFSVIMEQTKIDPRALELELTESMLMRNVDKAMETLAGFKRLGLSLAVDDFGTGYSSLSNLKRFPIDTLKIDRAFVQELPANSQDRAIAQAIIAMGKSLGMTVVAEGIETLEQADYLREQACDELQGFYFSKAVCADDLTSMLAAQDRLSKKGIARDVSSFAAVPYG